MRTTVVLDEDVVAAIERLRRERSLGMSQALNELVRAGLATRPARTRFRQRTRRMGLRIDVSNIGEALEVLEGPDGR
jgi:hypothetical protein